jgi:glycosyltransferase involved in cell wall biosynthesis
VKPLVSILIPAYNAEKWIAETLASALAQTYPRKEIIVVDDASTDGTPEVVRRSAGVQVNFVRQPHVGASAARNRALREAQGDFIQYLDADDLLSPDKIEHQLRLAAGDAPVTVLTAEWARFRRNDPSKAVFSSDPLWTDLAPVDWLVRAWEGHHMMHPAAWLVPRAISERAGQWNESLSLDDDGEYFSRVAVAASQIKFCPGARTFYRFGHTNSLSQKNDRAAWESKFRSVDLSTRHLLNTENSPRTRHACATRFQRFIFEFGPYAPDLEQQAEVKVREYGGTDVQPFGGPAFKALCRILGWKRAKKLQVIAFRYGYVI